MAQKWNLQDIVPPDRRRQSSTPQREPSSRRPEAPASRQDIATPRERAVPRGRERAAPQNIPPVREPSLDPMVPQEDLSQVYMDPHDNVDAVVERLEIEDGRLARLRKYIIGGIMFAIILGVGLGITMALSGAEVTVHPKKHDTTVQATFAAKLKPGPGELGYELLTLEETGERQVAAKGKEDIKEQAKGKITVYNGFSTTPQRLIKNTRFESPSGLIYRISNSIVIPGYKKDANGVTTPGSVVTDVFADSTGEAYNVDEARFTIPGLKGSEQYEKMYAETAEGGIQGGFEGSKFVIDENELSTTKQKLHTELRDKLLSRIQSERPNGFILFDPSVTFMYDSMPAEEGSDGTAVIKERARLQVPLFREPDFSNFIAQSTVPGYDRQPVRIEDTKKLNFTYDPPVTDDIALAESIMFKLAGPVRIIWQIDHEKLKEELVEVSKSEAPKVFAKYSSIEGAETVIRPLWKTHFPKSTEDIVVTEVLEE